MKLWVFLENPRGCASRRGPRPEEDVIAVSSVEMEDDGIIAERRRLKVRHRGCQCSAFQIEHGHRAKAVSIALAPHRQGLLRADGFANAHCALGRRA